MSFKNPSGTSPSLTSPMPPFPTPWTLIRTKQRPTLVLSPAPSAAAFPYIAHAPLRTLAFTFHPDDAVDGCAMAARFVARRVKGPLRAGKDQYEYPAFKQLQISIARDVDPESRLYQPGTQEYARMERERDEALAALLAECKDAGIEACVRGLD